MSLLPQRKKSAEEIAELRGNLGVPTQSRADDTAAFADAAPLPKIDADAFDLKEVKSPVEDFSFVPNLAIDPSIHNEPALEAEPAPENVESDGKIPTRKRSPSEIDHLRRQIAFTQVEQVYDPRLQKAHPFLVALGYIPVLIGASIAWFYNPPIIVTAPFVATSMLVALYLLLRKPISRHHAGFIFAICFLAIAFGILHFLPQLQHAA
jgi:hypothetical protein